MEREDNLDLVFSALANRTRRALLARLGQSAASITDLAGPLDMTFPAVSKHLRVLEAAGLVRREIDGRIHQCSLQTAPLKSAGQWLEEYSRFWDETLEALDRHVTGGGV